MMKKMLADEDDESHTNKNNNKDKTNDRKTG
jgi:hypothetical protein